MTNVIKKLIKDGVEYEIQGTNADATSSTKGLVKLGSDTTQTTAANNPSSTANRTYPIQTNSSGQMVVNVPWEDSQTGSATSSVAGTLKLGSDTTQTTAANAVSSTASRSYALQLNSSGQGVVNVPWTDHTYAASDFDIKDIADSTSLRTTWSGKQDKIVAGTNISIANDGKTISATDTTYSASDFDIKDLSDSTSLRTTWSGKQDALDTQTAYTSKGTASKVPQITTNTLGQVTGITEVSINYPSQVSDTAYASSWDGVTSTAPSKNAVYDKISAMDTTISGKADDSNVVHKTGNETISGEKTFSSNVNYGYTQTYRDAISGSPSAYAYGVYQWGDNMQYTLRNAANNAYINTAFELTPTNMNVARTLVVPSKTTAATNSGTLVATEAQVYAKANTSDVLTKTNTTSYTPSADYNPATKKYVDDSVSAAKASAIQVTLTSSGWNSNTQTVTATGVTANNTVIVSPAPASFTDYGTAQIYASAQASNSLTFTCGTAPSSNITVNVVIMN